MCTLMLPEEQAHQMVDWCVWCVGSGSWRSSSAGAPVFPQELAALLLARLGAPCSENMAVGSDSASLEDHWLTGKANLGVALLSFPQKLLGPTTALPKPSTHEDKSLPPIMLIVAYPLLRFHPRITRIEKNKDKIQQ